MNSLDLARVSAVTDRDLTSARNANRLMLEGEHAKARLRRLSAPSHAAELAKQMPCRALELAGTRVAASGLDLARVSAVTDRDLTAARNAKRLMLEGERAKARLRELSAPSHAAELAKQRVGAVTDRDLTAATNAKRLMLEGEHAKARLRRLSAPSHAAELAKQMPCRALKLAGTRVAASGEVNETIKFSRGTIRSNS